MLGKSRWFALRKTGFGVTPSSWQGLLYVIAIVAVPLALIFSLTNSIVIASLVILWFLFIIFDATGIIAELKKSSRK